MRNFCGYMNEFCYADKTFNCKRTCSKFINIEHERRDDTRTFCGYVFAIRLLYLVTMIPGKKNSEWDQSGTYVSKGERQ